MNAAMHPLSATSTYSRASMQRGTGWRGPSAPLDGRGAHILGVVTSRSLGFIRLARVVVSLISTS